MSFKLIRVFSKDAVTFFNELKIIIPVYKLQTIFFGIELLEIVSIFGGSAQWSEKGKKMEICKEAYLGRIWTLMKMLFHNVEAPKLQFWKTGSSEN